MKKLCINITRARCYYLATESREGAAPVVTAIGHFRNEPPAEVKDYGAEAGSADIILSASFSEADMVPFDKTMDWEDYRRLLLLDMKITHGKEDTDDFFINPVKLAPRAGGTSYDILTQRFDLNVISDETKGFPDGILAKGKLASSIAAIIKCYRRNYDSGGRATILFFEDDIIHMLEMNEYDLVSYSYASGSDDHMNELPQGLGAATRLLLTGNTLTKDIYDKLRVRLAQVAVERMSPFRAFAAPPDNSIREFALKYSHIYAVSAGACFGD